MDPFKFFMYALIILLIWLIFIRFVFVDFDWKRFFGFIHVNRVFHFKSKLQYENYYEYFDELFNYMLLGDDKNFKEAFFRFHVFLVFKYWNGVISFNEVFHCIQSCLVDWLVDNTYFPDVYLVDVLSESMINLFDVKERLEEMEDRYDLVGQNGNAIKFNEWLRLNLSIKETLDANLVEFIKSFCKIKDINMLDANSKHGRIIFNTFKMSNIKKINKDV